MIRNPDDEQPIKTRLLRLAEACKYAPSLRFETERGTRWIHLAVRGGHGDEGTSGWTEDGDPNERFDGLVLEYQVSDGDVGDRASSSDFFSLSEALDEAVREAEHARNEVRLRKGESLWLVVQGLAHLEARAIPWTETVVAWLLSVQKAVTELEALGTATLTVVSHEIPSVLLHSPPYLTRSGVAYGAFDILSLAPTQRLHPNVSVVAAPRGFAFGDRGEGPIVPWSALHEPLDQPKPKAPAARKERRR